jgi:methanogenic corrinoid protein MtbC1
MADEPAAVEAAYEAVAAALDDHDKATAVRTAVEAVSSGSVSIPALYRDVLSRILADTGEAWHRGETAIWEEHLASATVRTIVEIVYPGVLKAKAERAPAGRSVLLACPPEEAHDLGLRMVADRFDMAGWMTYFLGPDTPVQEIADAARRLGVDAVVMSSSTHFHRLAVRHAVDALKKELPDTDIWVGGPAFMGAATGWLPQEIVNLEELLGGEG